MRNGLPPGQFRASREASANPVGSESFSLDLFHERRRLDAKDLRDLDEFKDVELSFTRLELPDE
jgi:hypothetical protein